MTASKLLAQVAGGVAVHFPQQNRHLFNPRQNWWDMAWSNPENTNKTLRGKKFVLVEFVWLLLGRFRVVPFVRNPFEVEFAFNFFDSPFTCASVFDGVLFLRPNLGNLYIHTRRSPTSYCQYKWSYKPYKWPYKWVTRVITPYKWSCGPLLITGRDPPCIYIYIYTR